MLENTLIVYCDPFSGHVQANDGPSTSVLENPLIVSPYAVPYRTPSRCGLLVYLLNDGLSHEAQINVRWCESPISMLNSTSVS